MKPGLITSENGLTLQGVEKGHKTYGLNIIYSHHVSSLSILLRQISQNPLNLILAAAAILAFFTGDKTTGIYVLSMIFVSALLGFWNEFSAEKTIATLLKQISLNAVVVRGGEKLEVPVEQLTIGDLVLLAPGSVIPADLRFIRTENLEINEAVLTGESKSVPKSTKTDNNTGFMGTVVESGWAQGEVIRIGKNTQFGKIAEKVSFTKPQTQFQKGLAGFGSLIVKTILILTLIIFSVNTFLGHNPLISLLFALAVAVGLTPELLPVIVTVGLSHGAGILAKRHVVTKQLIAIENLGNMDVLCTDKTGTLTEGTIKVTSFLDSNGKDNQDLIKLGLLCNSAVIHHKAIGNTIDVALWNYARKEGFVLDPTSKKIYEEPFDYEKRFMYCVITEGKENILIAKGAPEIIIKTLADKLQGEDLIKQFTNLSQQGYRVIALATKKISSHQDYHWSDASALTFAGFITFLDVPKSSARFALSDLQSLNVTVKVITGDDEIVTRKICKEVGMDITKLIAGDKLDNFSDGQLLKIVDETNVFVRVSPEQKLRIIKALQRNGHTVGFLGDGINDTPALHSADVGISVNSAIDVAKEAAQVVLLRSGLDIIADGIKEGRKTFINTIKYILMGTGSNFGEMVSIAGASFFLPFLPMTPVQILLENGLYDISQLPIAFDNVDTKLLIKPKHWDINMIYHFMIFFGLLSAAFTFATFFIILNIFHAGITLFQTAVFLESITTELIVVFVVRTTKIPFFKSLPGKWLILSCLIALILTLVLPFSGLAKSLNLEPPTFSLLSVLAILLLAYAFTLEIIKKTFLKKYSF